MVLAVDGRVRTDALARYGLTLPILWSTMRQAGISHPSQVALAVLEPNGRISVLRTGQPVHPRALLGVKGAHLVQEQLREAGHLHTAPLPPEDTGPSGGSAPVGAPARESPQE